MANTRRACVHRGGKFAGQCIRLFIYQVSSNKHFAVQGNALAFFGQKLDFIILPVFYQTSVLIRNSPSRYRLYY
jgi:hypothetical protein